MARLQLSTKHLQITKAQKRTLVTIGVASFLTIFSLVASNALLGQLRYQNRVMAEKKQALTNLKDNIKVATALQESYKKFTDTNENIIGGNPKGNGDRDGDNAKIVLDALPSQYDFPALATSLEKLPSLSTAADKNIKVDNITGSDDEIAQSKSSTTPKPQPVPIPFQLGVSGSYASMQGFIETLQRSIRPFTIQSMSLSGNDAQMKVTIKAETYYQPQKNLSVTTKVIK